MPSLQYLHVHRCETPAEIENESMVKSMCVCGGDSVETEALFQEIFLHPGQLYHSPLPGGREGEKRRECRLSIDQSKTGGDLLG